MFGRVEGQYTTIVCEECQTSTQHFFYLKKHTKKTTAAFTLYISSYHVNHSPPSLPPSSYRGDFAFAKSIIIRFIRWLKPLKKPEEEK